MHRILQDLASDNEDSQTGEIRYGNHILRKLIHISAIFYYAVERWRKAYIDDPPPQLPSQKRHHTTGHDTRQILKWKRVRKGDLAICQAIAGRDVGGGGVVEDGVGAD